MGKYSRHAPDKVTKKDPSQTFAWRSIGCFLMVVVPALSIFAAIQTVNSSLSAYIPEQLMGYPVLPNYLFATSGLEMIFSPIANTENLYALLLVSAMYTMVLGGLISLLYAVIYRIINPKRYGPTDAPPPKYKAKRYKR